MHRVYNYANDMSHQEVISMPMISIIPIISMPIIMMPMTQCPTKECPRHQVTVGGGLPPASQLRVSDSPGKDPDAPQKILLQKSPSLTGPIFPSTCEPE